MRKLSAVLDGVYKLGAYCAGLLLILLCGLILWSVLARLLGVYAGGVTDLAGYVMATSTFLALAYTFRSGGHIRVQLLVQRLGDGPRRKVEVACLGFMTLIASFIGWYMTRLTYDSWDFEERSQGADAILIWIPQAPVAVGAWLMAVAVAHSFVQSIFDYDAIDPTVGEGASEV